MNAPSQTDGSLKIMIEKHLKANKNSNKIRKENKNIKASKSTAPSSFPSYNCHLTHDSSDDEKMLKTPFHVEMLVESSQK